MTACTRLAFLPCFQLTARSKLISDSDRLASFHTHKLVCKHRSQPHTCSAFISVAALRIHVLGSNSGCKCVPGSAAGLVFPLRLLSEKQFDIQSGKLGYTPRCYSSLSLHSPRTIA